MATTVKDNDDKLSGWLKSNLFSIGNLVLIVATFSYNYGVLNSKILNIDTHMAASEVKMAAFEVRMNDMQKNVNDIPAHEARIVLLEKKTDDLAVLKNIVQTQSDNIRQLTETVRADHDILLRYVTAAETKK